MLYSNQNLGTNDEQIINIINTTFKKAKELASKHGPLIFVKVDQEYYK